MFRPCLRPKRWVTNRKTWEKVLYWHLMSEQASHKPVTVDDWSLVGPPPGDEDRRMAIDDWCRPSSDPGVFGFTHFQPSEACC